jgi:hypothetical protein
MDRDEAQALADSVLADLRKLSYAECCRMIREVSTRSVRARDGKEYELEIQAMWDAKTNGNVRVLVAVSGGGWSDFVPLCRDFVIAPDGSFIGESRESTDA